MFQLVPYPYSSIPCFDPDFQFVQKMQDPSHAPPLPWDFSSTAVIQDTDLPNEYPSLLLSTWNLEPSARPSFKQLQHVLGEALARQSSNGPGNFYLYL